MATIERISGKQYLSRLAFHVIARASVQFVNFVSDDLLIGDDIDAVREDDKECRFCFAEFKERSRFKGSCQGRNRGKSGSFSRVRVNLVPWVLSLPPSR